MAKKKRKIILEGAIEVPAGPGAEEHAVEEIAARLGLEDEPKESKADFDFEKEVAAEVKALEQSSGPGFTPPFDMGSYVRREVVMGGQAIVVKEDPGYRFGPVWVLCPDQEFSFDYHGPDRDYKYEARLAADDEKQLGALVDRFLSAVNSPVIFGGLKIYLHAAQGHGRAPEHLASGQVSLKVELIFRASAP